MKKCKLTAIAAIILIVAISISVLSGCAGARQDREIAGTPEYAGVTLTTDEGGEVDIKTSRVAAAESAQSLETYTITATAKDENGNTDTVCQDFTFSIGWLSASVTDEISDYATLTKLSGSAVQVSFLQAFPQVISITAVSDWTPTVSKTIKCNCVRRFQKFKYYPGQNEENQYVIPFGSSIPMFNGYLLDTGTVNPNFAITGLNYQVFGDKASTFISNVRNSAYYKTFAAIPYCAEMIAANHNFSGNLFDKTTYFTAKSDRTAKFNIDVWSIACKMFGIRDFNNATLIKYVNNIGSQGDINYLTYALYDAALKTYGVPGFPCTIKYTITEKYNNSTLSTITVDSLGTQTSIFPPIYKDRDIFYIDMSSVTLPE